MSHVSEPSQAGTPHKLAARIVREYFGVETLFDSRKSTNGGRRVIHFIGSDTNCVLARYVYIYLVRLMRDAWRLRANRRLRDRDGFLHGFAIVIERLIPPTFNISGLVVSAEAYIDGVILAGDGRLVKSRPKKSTFADAAFHNGWKAGSKATIHNAMTTSSTTPLLS